MIYANENYNVKKTILDKWYLANSENGDIIDINEVTADIFNIISSHNTTMEQLIDKVCEIYDVIADEIEADVKEIVDRLTEYNVIY